MILMSDNVPLTPDLIFSGYAQGFFPMAEGSSGPVYWYDPDPRTILPLRDFHQPRRLARTVRALTYDIRLNSSFEEVVRACASRAEAWISEEIVGSYTALHRMGGAHSVEAWQDGRLVGGLYGVAIGGAFMGESMFSRARDASKVCLVHLVERLKERGYELLDAQLPNPHLDQFGAVCIPRNEYHALLEQVLDKSCTFIED